LVGGGKSNSNNNNKTHNEAVKPKANASLLDSREDRDIQGPEEGSTYQNYFCQYIHAFQSCVMLFSELACSALHRIRLAFIDNN
jgi:hypothetical protein